MCGVLFLTVELPRMWKVKRTRPRPWLGCRRLVPAWCGPASVRVGDENREWGGKCRKDLISNMLFRNFRISYFFLFVYSLSKTNHYNCLISNTRDCMLRAFRPILVSAALWTFCCKDFVGYKKIVLFINSNILYLLFTAINLRISC